MRPEDRVEMQRRLNQEELLIRHGFEPIPENGGELWISCEPGGVPELWTRAQALAELAVLDRGAPCFTNILDTTLAASRQGLRIEALMGQERTGDEPTDVEDEPERGSS